MRSTITLALAGIFLMGMPFTGADSADAHSRKSRIQVRVASGHRYVDHRYWTDLDVRLVRDYYRPRTRTLPPGLQRRYLRTGQLPPGWAKRVQPIPRHLGRQLIRLPRGYRRGVVDGRAIVYGPGGLVVDVAVLF